VKKVNWVHISNVRYIKNLSTMGINLLSARMWLLNLSIPPRTSLVDERKIKDIEVEMTILDGEIVWNKMG
jgi:hypothetical protein